MILFFIKHNKYCTKLFENNNTIAYLYKLCKIYEAENEQVLVNFVTLNKIINDPLF